MVRESGCLAFSERGGSPMGHLDGPSCMTLTHRWVDFMYRMATGSRRVRNLLTPVGAICFGLLVLLIVVSSLHVDRWIGITALLPGHLCIVVSLPLFTIASIMIGRSVHHFLNAEGTPVASEGFLRIDFHFRRD